MSYQLSSNGNWVIELYLFNNVLYFILSVKIVSGLISNPVWILIFLKIASVK